MGCGGSKGADASVELGDDVEPSVLEQSLKQAAEAVQAAASAAEAARAGAQRASEAARAAAAAAALVAKAAGPAAAAAAAAAKAFQAAQEEQQSVMLPRGDAAASLLPSDELSPRVRRPSTAKQVSFGHRIHDEEVFEFEDEPDTPDDSETEASDVESLDRMPVTPSVPSAPPPARNGGVKPRTSSPLAVSVAAGSPVPIRDQVQRALAHIHAPLKSPKALANAAPLQCCTPAMLRVPLRRPSLQS